MPTFALSATMPVSVGTSHIQPTRMGNLPSGALVINDSANARVWIGPTSAVGVGAGTPLDPKTTVRLTRDGDWYAIVDTNSTGPVQLYVTPYVDQWQPSPTDIATATALAIVESGVPFIDQPVDIGFASPTVLASGASRTEATINVERWQSFYSWWGWSPVVNQYLQVTLSWLDQSSAVIDQDIIVYNGQGAGSPVTSLGKAFARGPMRGSFLSITLTNLGTLPGSYNFNMYGSLRNVQAMRCIEDTATMNNIFEGQILPGALASVTQYFPLYSGQVVGSIQSVGTGGQTVRVILQTGPNSSAMFDKTYTISTTPADFALPFMFARQPMKLFVQNNGAGAANGVRATFMGDEPA